MGPRVIPTVLLAALLFGCVSHEGTYSPGCVAYAGSNITLDDSKFVWEKYTDQVVVDDGGEVVNQFPGYPMRGSYRIDGQLVYMETNEGDSLENMYLQRRDDHYYLLTAAQFAAWEQTGNYADCTLLLSDNQDD